MYMYNIKVACHCAFHCKLQRPSSSSSSSTSLNPYHASKAVAPTYKLADKPFFITRNHEAGQHLEPASPSVKPCEIPVISYKLDYKPAIETIWYTVSIIITINPLSPMFKTT